MSIATAENIAHCGDEWTLGHKDLGVVLPDRTRATHYYTLVPPSVGKEYLQLSQSSSNLHQLFFFNYYEDPTVSTSASCKRFPLLNVRGIELPDFVQKFEVIFVACPVDFGLITSG